MKTSDLVLLGIGAYLLFKSQNNNAPSRARSAPVTELGGAPSPTNEPIEVVAPVIEVAPVVAPVVQPLGIYTSRGFTPVGSGSGYQSTIANVNGTPVLATRTGSGVTTAQFGAIGAAGSFSVTDNSSNRVQIDATHPYGSYI